MLTKEWVEETIEQNLQPEWDVDDGYYIGGIHGVAAAITQAAEEETATLRRTIALGAEYARKAMGSLGTGGHGLVGILDDLLGILDADGTKVEGEVADLRAQVALMAEALGGIREVAIDSVGMEDEDYNWIILRTNKALSAAPKVVWHGKVQVTLKNDLMLLDDGTEALRELKYPYQVDAVLLEYSRHPEQAQESEHEIPA